MSGVKETWWRVNGGAWTKGNSVDIPAEQRGDFGLDWYSVDNAGNVETPEKSAFFTAYNRYEEDASQIVYRGSWSTTIGETWSGGSYSRSSSANAAVYITYTGKVAEFFFPTGPDLGRVPIPARLGDMDAVDALRCDRHQEKLRVVGATSGTHVLTIESLDSKNAASTGTAIGLDAVDVDGVLVVDTTRADHDR